MYSYNYKNIHIQSLNFSAYTNDIIIKYLILIFNS